MQTYALSINYLFFPCYIKADPNNIKAPSTEAVKDANGNTVNLFDWMESMK